MQLENSLWELVAGQKSAEEAWSDMTGAGCLGAAPPAREEEQILGTLDVG